MRDYVRPVAAALGVATLVAAISVLAHSGAFAQAKQQQMAPPAKQAPAQAAPQPAQQPELKQIALTDKQVESVLAAQKDMDAVTDKIPDNAPPDPKIDAKLDDVAKKYGFANYPDYNTVIDNISLVLGGIDPATKKYVGAEAVIKSQIAQINADKKMSAKDKKDTLADLNEALKQKQPDIQNKGNIDLVIKYYDKLSEALGGDDQ
jgi:multidrug efflux pump subunit AcrB